ncbi:putative HEN1, double-stranded RNA binding domain 2 [Helianthus annuus]|uniref:HEN1 double-stranded RNA binding domain-containing protein n=1 Tax=Helianthus annuus TaxID=4232 RepID=A0A9K3J9Q8_HELAN|nr:hypothetical protein HanXRQr2_Chr04g0181021 [Helianthus annuus]KAJ0582053.1 putative HEN1, double-stranded RNA binding domain 2 [Helianthus annuus]KAJ0590191.1 putative HEN1, double-stranded RNA binding domain 2 [Helianthus annuus]KAJ0598036.1 putative HEN1, double-stranded RNA binding domain 2 [Helianthus annuus]KAJ0758666.1 putative HEN1, double-stranded RNA binding domain 2 [Helianthus annuus]
MNGSIHFISSSFWISILIASDLEVGYLLTFRLLMNKLPTGIYKLSREAVLAAELPPKFRTRSNWRGLFPRDILCTFCRQHRLPEPVFSLIVTKGVRGAHLIGESPILHVTNQIKPRQLP